MTTIVRANLNTFNTVEDATGGTVPGDAATGHVMRMVEEFEDFLDPTETPFTSSMRKGAPVDQRKVEWGTGALTPNVATLNEALDTTEVDVDVNTGHGKRFQVDSIIKIDSEIMRVTGIAVDTLTVVRARGGSTAAAHTTAATIDIIGIGGLENSDYPQGPMTFGDLDHNFVQRFQRYLQIDLRENVTPNWEFRDSNHMAALMARTAKEVAILREKAALMGGREAGSSTASSLMGGLDGYIASGTTYNLSAGLLDVQDLDTALSDLWTNVGPENAAKTAIMNMNAKRIVSSLINPNRRFTSDTTKATLKFESVELDAGILTFMVSRYVPAGVIYFVNMDDISLHSYKNLDWHERMTATQGDYEKTALAGDFTIMFKNNATRAKIHNFSTTLADYQTF